MLVPMQMPPGLVSRGTDRQSAGRYHDGNLVRFYEGDVRPIGGWRQLSREAVSGVARELTAWATIDNRTLAGIGTTEGLFVMTQGGTIYDVTPSGFVTGRVDRVNGGGYGTGNYAVGVYGQPIVSETATLPPSAWTLTQWGENLVGVMNTDRRIYEWTPAGGTFGAALPIQNAPSARSIVVTRERIMFALAADGDPRLVRWSQQEDNTDWTPTPTNLAGDKRLETPGTLQCGLPLQTGALLFTDTDVHLAQFIDSALVYSFQLVSDGSGVIAPGAAVLIDGRAVWMGPEGFWVFNGFVEPLPCDISDDVFGELNRAQREKITAWHNSAFGEVWWHYPGENSTEPDRYCVWSYREGHWSSGDLPRTAGVDMSPFDRPLLIDSAGVVYEHERGDDLGGGNAWVEGGPLELGTGTDVIDINGYVPDNRTIGGVKMSLRSRYYPHGDERSFGPFPVDEKIDFRVNGREHYVRFDGEPNTDWRIGVPRLDIRKRGRR